MSESTRGRGRGSKASGGTGRGGASSGPGRQSGSTHDDRPKREAILDLNTYVNKKIRVKFAGGREVQGTLKGFDQLLNLVMDDVEELLTDPSTNLPLDPPQHRKLGLVVARGTSLTVLNPVEGYEAISNPFL